MEIKKVVKINIEEMIYHKFDISDAEWKLIKLHMTDQPRQHGGITEKRSEVYQYNDCDT